MSLPKIKELEISDEETGTISWICSHLAVPADAAVSLNAVMDEYHPYSTGYFHIQDMVPEDTSSWPIYTQAKSLVLTVNQSDGICLDAQLHTGDDVSEADGYLSLNVSDLDKDNMNHFLFDALHQSLHVFASASILSLTIYAEDIETWQGDVEGVLFDCDLWAGVFYQLSHLEYLECCERSDIIEPLLEALATSSPTGTYVPKLKTLVIEGDHKDDRVVDTLVRACFFRSSHGARLSKLSLEGRRPYADDEERLVGLVDCLDIC